MNRPDFEAHGLKPFRPFEGKAGVMQYYEAPAEMFEDPEALEQWAGGAIAAGFRAQVQKEALKTAYGLGVLGFIESDLASAGQPGSSLIEPQRASTTSAHSTPRLACNAAISCFRLSHIKVKLLVVVSRSGMEGRTSAAGRAKISHP